MHGIHACPSSSPRKSVDGSALVARTLVPYNLKPSDEEVEALVVGLSRHGEQLLSDIVRLGKSVAATAAIKNWRHLTSRGPEDSPLGVWNHARALARVVKAFRRTIDQAG